VSDNHIAERKIILQCAAAADTNQGCYANLAQFFNGDRRGGPPIPVESTKISMP
jgi:hypothetical protein